MVDDKTVIPVAADRAVGTRTAIERVGATATKQGIIAGETVEMVRAASCPGGRITRDHVIDAVAGPIDAARSGERQVFDIRAEGPSSGRQGSYPPRPLHLPRPRREWHPPHIRIIAVAAKHPVVARPAIKRVVAGPSEQKIGPGATRQGSLPSPP